MLRQPLALLALCLLSSFASAHEDDLESVFENFATRGCVKASRAQKRKVDQGNAKKAKFVQRCSEATDNSPWCAQLLRPNPDSLAIFKCTYGANQLHQLIHPDESTWDSAFETVRIVEALVHAGVEVCEIYNWWRPEPYNRNVGGSPTRHPFGTSGDVRFCTKAAQESAFLKLCDMRKTGRVRAVGYYPGTGLHFGVGDSRANTWGKECPP